MCRPVSFFIMGVIVFIIMPNSSAIEISAHNSSNFKDQKIKIIIILVGAMIGFIAPLTSSVIASINRMFRYGAFSSHLLTVVCHYSLD